MGIKGREFGHLLLSFAHLHSHYLPPTPTQNAHSPRKSDKNCHELTIIVSGADEQKTVIAVNKRVANPGTKLAL